MQKTSSWLIEIAKELAVIGDKVMNFQKNN